MAQYADTDRRVDPDSTAHLIHRATEQLSTLIRDELALARIEIAEKGRRLGRGAGLLGGAGLLSVFAVGALVTAAICGLVAAGMPAWLSALTVAVVLLLLAGGAVLVGWAQLRKAGPPVPTDVMAGVRADLDTVTHAIRGA
ncbi:hypothetical protein GCM10010124_04700 [Pilimelia terevasa]|uniref:Phage holin family protein n=1 Tax=Pilimelia terevasa TaxID=53372 RepID=A0A8J3FG18_9ACTN|nr:phage holin family protein [Pilimelia terevasa]GGK15170.1 hypothetical protein GCM10010124_04700 [Pilimelia terevasa]